MTPRPIEDLLVDISALWSALDSEAEPCELARTPTATLIALMDQLGVQRVKVPTELGGDDLWLADQFQWFIALAHACPTAGWTGFVHAGAAARASKGLPEAGGAEGFANGVPFLTAVAAPEGYHKNADAGLILNGRWRYASGVAHSEWALLTSVGDDEVLMAAVPIDDCVIGDDWNVMSLQGTGSFDVAVENLFIPERRIIRSLTTALRGGPFHTIGFPATATAEGAGFIIGVSERFVQELTTFACTTTRGSQGRIADRGAFAYELGKSEMQIAAARAHAAHVFTEADSAIRHSEQLTAREEADLVSVMSHSAMLANDAVHRLFDFAGAGSLSNHSVLQRCYRDARGLAQHLVASNASFDRRGQALLDDPSKG